MGPYEVLSLVGIIALIAYLAIIPWTFITFWIWVPGWTLLANLALLIAALLNYPSGIEDPAQLHHQREEWARNFMLLFAYLIYFCGACALSMWIYSRAEQRQEKKDNARKRAKREYEETTELGMAELRKEGLA